MKANKTHTPPPVIQWLCPKTSHYNFNIEKGIREENDQSYDDYNYEQVTVLNPVTREGIKSAIVDQGYDLGLLEAVIDSDCDNLGIA